MGNDQRHGGIDQAALLAALLAVFFQLTGDPGPWSPVNTALGLILLLMISAYAQPATGRRLGTLHLQVLSVAVGAALSMCLVVAWPAQQTVVLGLARGFHADTGDDSIGDYTTWYVFPLILVAGSWLTYRFIARRLAAAAASTETATQPSSGQASSKASEPDAAVTAVN